MHSFTTYFSELAHLSVRRVAILLFLHLLLFCSNISLTYIWKTLKVFWLNLFTNSLTYIQFLKVKPSLKITYNPIALQISPSVNCFVNKTSSGSNWDFTLSPLPYLTLINQLLHISSFYHFFPLLISSDPLQLW